MKNLILKGKTEVDGMKFNHIEGGFGEGKKSMLVKDISEIHQKELKYINEAINNNRKRFKNNIDIIDLKSVDLIDRDFLNDLGFSNSSIANSNNIYILSERGYSKLLKILEDDFAWEQYEKLVDDYFSLREKNSQSLPTMSQTEIIAMMAQNNVEIEKKANKALELAEKADKQINNALDVFTAPPDDNWRDAMNSKMRGMCQSYGLNYPVFYGDIYAELEMLARVNLSTRLTKLRKRMLANGATKTDCKNVTKLEIVERDPKLRPIFEGIVRKYQAKYAIESGVN